MSPLLLAAALAVPPVDRDGGLAPVLTYEPHWLVAPYKVDLRPRFSAWGPGPDGGVVVVADGAAWVVDAQGGVDRARWGGVEDYLWANGHLVAGADGLWYCDDRLGLAHVDADGRLSHRAWGRPPDGTCELYRAGEGFVAVQRTRDVAWSVGREGAQGAPFDVTGDRFRPCGSGPDGEALGLAVAGPEVQLVSLGPDLRALAVRWSVDTQAVPEGPWLRDARFDRCALRDGRAVLGTDTEVAVWSGTTLVAALRNGAPLAPGAAPAPGVGSYAFDGVDLAVPMDAGAALLVLDGRDGRARFYAARDPGGGAEALAAEGRWLRALRAWSVVPQTDAVQLGRAEAMARAGWWEEVVATTLGPAASAGDRSRLDRLVASVRARMLLAWAGRGHTGRGWDGLLGARAPRTPGEFAGPVSTELKALGTAHADLPEVWRALAATAVHTWDRRTRLDALARLAPLDPDAPELFDLYEARGDAAALAPRVGDDPARRARLLRVQGDAAGALAALGTPLDTDGQALRARLLADTGDLDGAIAAWTPLVAGPLATDPSAHAALGVAQLRRGLVELSVQSLLTARGLDPADPSHAANLALAWAALDKRAEALAALQALPADPVVRHQIAVLQAPPKPPRGGGAVAVLPFDTAGGLVERVGLGDMVATMLVTELAASAKVVERARIDALLAEQDLQASRHVDPATAVRLGKLAGAKQLVLGNVAEFDGVVALDLRLVDVASGQVVRTSKARAPLEVEALRSALAEAGLALVR